MISVLFKDGTRGRFVKHVVGGACMIGEPTAYVICEEKRVYIVPGESASWIEV